MSRSKRGLEWLVPCRWKQCNLCWGKGKLRALPPTCPKCKGDGRVPTAYTVDFDKVPA